MEAVIDAPDRPTLVAFQNAFHSWCARVACHIAARNDDAWIDTHARMLQRAQLKIATRYLIPHIIGVALAKAFSDGNPED